MKNLLLVLVFGFCLIGCSSKPSCSDEEVIGLVKEIVLENGGLAKLDIIHEKGKVLTFENGEVPDKYELFTTYLLAISSRYKKYTLEEFYATDTSKLSEDRQQAFNRLKIKVDEFIKQKPISIMTVNDSDIVVQCRVKLADDAEFLNFSAQYTDDGDLYVELEGRNINF
ncbi:hypothetical protein CHL_1566 [Campylobacter hyointestinalis subsp. lawsonii CCUG 27631]|uniref:hypothetical protein n=1 Tax=Campylobacter hyointestinalis TaxID=198 RepID=UPI0007C8E407|nr:hypothetical protein [Campylobacter hyointestinalis]ANE34871.1 hypothetical protein CHL_1566 [Campylobacter hyointestinalis subsp. lawsonii CCUG 27631]